jgi:hypothetical protein
MNAFWYSPLWLDSEMPAMSVNPGATTLHVMLCLPISSAITRASWISPAFETACGPDIGRALFPAVEPMRMIRPPWPCLMSCRPTARLSKNAPRS